MKKLGISLVFVSSLAAAAYAATAWSHAAQLTQCGVRSSSAMPITAALEQWRCSENHAAATLSPRR